MVRQKGWYNMKELKNAVIVNGVAYQINATEAQKIAELLGLAKVAQTSAPKKSEPKTESKKQTSEPKTEAPKKETRIVGSLECSGKFVRTVKGAFLSSKARYAIGMSATEDFGATKLHKGDSLYDRYSKEDKYVQIYVFPTEEDASKFMDNQQSRMNKTK